VTYEWIKSNILRVEISYKSLSIDFYDEYFTYTWRDVIGGLLGYDMAIIFISCYLLVYR